MIFMAIKIKKLRTMGQDELNKQLNELQLELSKERAAAEVGTVKNPGRISAIRLTIARIHTITTEKEKRVARPQVGKEAR